jgi:hypothetical protein
VQYQLTGDRITAVLTAAAALASYLARGATHKPLLSVTQRGARAAADSGARKNK